MSDWRERTELLIGSDGLKKLSESHVVVVGTGGVGAAAAEMLVRAGVGHLTVIDSDVVSVSNINRQLIALNSTVGRSKVEVLCERLRDINPDVGLTPLSSYIKEGDIPVGHPDFLVDAIDTLSPKIALIQHCLAEGIPFVSSMGSGAKTDVTAVKIADISRTYQCPLAHMLRKRLHKLGITGGFQAVFSSELPREDAVVLEESTNKKSQVGTVSYLPTVFGCACAQVAVCHILK